MTFEVQNKANYILEVYGSQIYKICGCQFGKTESAKRKRSLKMGTASHCK